MEKKKPKRSNVIKNLLMLIPNVIRLAFNITDLVGHEARIAMKSIIIIIMLSVIFACLLVTTWLCLLGLLFLYLVSLQLSWIVSLSIILLLNIIILSVIGLYALKVKQHLLFSETRREISYIAHLYKKL